MTRKSILSFPSGRIAKAKSQRSGPPLTLEEQMKADAAKFVQEQKQRAQEQEQEQQQEEDHAAGSLDAWTLGPRIEDPSPALSDDLMRV